jgi:hypothetical protein
VPHISLVFREMWDTEGLSLKPAAVPQIHKGALRSHQRTWAFTFGPYHLFLRIGTRQVQPVKLFPDTKSSSDADSIKPRGQQRPFPEPVLRFEETWTPQRRQSGRDGITCSPARQCRVGLVYEASPEGTAQNSIADGQDFMRNRLGGKPYVA